MRLQPGQVPPNFNEPHLRFTDRGVYDVILTQAIEIVSLLMQTAPKETIREFLKCEPLAHQLSVHAYYAPSESVRQPIIELMRLVIDNTGCVEL